MNQKTLRYFLLAGAVLIWGAIIFRVIKGLRQESYVLSVKKEIKPINYYTPEDSFILFANYPDPFIPPDADAFEKKDITLNQALQNSQYEKPSTIPVKAEFDINTIGYHGMIENPENKKKIAIITIAGKEWLAKEKDKINGIAIRKISKDILTLLVNGKTEEILRKPD